jgi:hypothetical protein
MGASPKTRISRCARHRAAIVSRAPSWRNQLSELSIAVLTFVCLTAAAFIGLFSDIIRTGPPQIETNTTVRIVANIFVVMTSLVLGLMLNSAKNTLETYNRNVHALGTNLILLDRTMRGLGPEAGEARQHLLQYVQVSLQEGDILEEDRSGNFS